MSGSGFRQLRLLFHSISTRPLAAIIQTDQAGEAVRKTTKLHRAAEVMSSNTQDSPRTVGPTALTVVQLRHATNSEDTEPKNRHADQLAASLQKDSRDKIVAAQANAGFRNSSYHALRRVSCEVDNRVLTLRGSVPSYYMKQVAQTVVLRLLDDGMIIHNRLTVDPTRSP